MATTTTPNGGTADTRRYLTAPDGRIMGGAAGVAPPQYGASATDVPAEFIWLSPQVGDSGVFGGDDGLAGYMPLAVVSAASGGGTMLSWVHADHMGVPTVYTNASGTAITGPSGYSVPAYPGQSQTLADLYYNRHRDYDPTTGRYIQADPIGLAGGASPYSYAMNNPVRYMDPDGRIAHLPALCIIGGIVGAAGTAIGEVVASGETSWTHVGAGAVAGCITGVAAPFVAPTLGGAMLLGGAGNVLQDGLTKYLDCEKWSLQSAATSFAFGLVGGLIGGKFKPAGKYIHATPHNAVNDAINNENVVEGAAGGFARGVSAGAATTAG